MSNNFEEDEGFVVSQIQHYIDIGAIKIVGFRNEGEAIFELNEIITKELAPELWEKHEQYVNEELLNLMDKDLMKVEYDENLEATMIFNKEGYNIAIDKGIIPIEDIYEN